MPNIVQAKATSPARLAMLAAALAVTFQANAATPATPAAPATTTTTTMPQKFDDNFSCETVRVCGAGEAAGLACATPAAVGFCRETQKLGISDRINTTKLPGDSRFPAGFYIYNSGDNLGQALSNQNIVGPACPKFGARTSHCSAFVRFAAKKIYGIDVQPDPDSSSSKYGWCFLTNPQHAALVQGESGFAIINGADNAADPVMAQIRANQGNLVIASVPGLSDEKAGHIAIVLPDTSRSADAIKADGPEVVQAGINNFAHTKALNGFWMHTDYGKRFSNVQYFFVAPKAGGASQ